MSNHKIATGLIKKYMEKKGFRGWTSLWNTVYYIDEDAINDVRLIKHELCHIEQMHREGKCMFMLKYIWYDLTVDYALNPYEIEAREREKQ